MAKKKLKLVYSTRDDAVLANNKSKKPLQSLPPQQQNIRIQLDRKRRRGKTVTVIGTFHLNQVDLKTLVKTLKQYCGAGGTSKGGEIEIQGDCRDKIRQKLLALGYRVK